MTELRTKLMANGLNAHTLKTTMDKFLSDCGFDKYPQLRTDRNGGDNCFKICQKTWRWYRDNGSITKDYAADIFVQAVKDMVSDSYQYGKYENFTEIQDYVKKAFNVA